MGRWFHRSKVQKAYILGVLSALAMCDQGTLSGKSPMASTVPKRKTQTHKFVKEHKDTSVTQDLALGAGFREFRTLNIHSHDEHCSDLKAMQLTSCSISEKQRL